ncbi:MAG: apolipoprotein N-acyltransferase [candidate division WOR-3 bacterium]
MTFFLFIFSIFLAILSSTPFYIWPLSLFFLFPLFLIIEKKRGFLTFFIFGIFYYTYHLFWLINLSKIVPEIKYILPVGLFFLILIESSFLGICGALSKKFLNSRISFILIPSFFTGIEFLRTLFEIAFPWAPFYLSWVKNLPGIQIVEITGPFFITFLIVLLNFMFYKFYKTRNLSYFFIFIFILSLNQIFGNFVLRKPFKGKEIKVAIYQPNLYLYLSYEEEINEGFKVYNELADSIRGFEPLISLWPESSLPGNLRYNPFVYGYVRDFVTKERTYLFMGSQDKENGKIYNTVFLISPYGEIVSKYHKVQLVPFGEAIPYDEKFKFLKKIDFGEGNFSRGKKLEPLKVNEYLFGVLICYESIFPEFSRKLVLNGAHAILNLTSDGWYGKTIGPIEHRDLFIFRAIETRRYLLRSARTGISCIIDPYGRIIEERGLFKKGIIKGIIKVPERDYKTIYVKYGEITGRISLFILIVSIILALIL